MNRLPIFILLVLFIAVGTAACDSDNDSVSEQEQLVRDNFDAADTNGDGVLDEGEIEAEIAKDFFNMDLDGDGEITENDHDHINDPEYKGIPVTAEERAELIYDTDDDEILTEDEYSESIREMFVNPMDTDGNGEITLEEALNFAPEEN